MTATRATFGLPKACVYMTGTLGALLDGGFETRMSSDATCDGRLVFDNAKHRTRPSEWRDLMMMVGRMKKEARILQNRAAINAGRA